MSRMCQIKASAGSGKTYALAEQYLQLLSSMADRGSVSPRHAPCKKRHISYNYEMGDILVITFTNAAVNEIRKRVIENLKNISLGKMEMKGIDKDKALICLEALLDNMEEMNVRTIDSLLHQIVRSAALSLGLNPDFEPVFKAADAVKPYLDKYMENAFLEEGEKRQAVKVAAETFLEHSLQEADPLILGKSLAEELESLLNDILLKKHAMTYSRNGKMKGLLDRAPYEIKSPLPYSDPQKVKEAHDKYYKAMLDKGMELKLLAEEYEAEPKNDKIKWNKGFKNFLDGLERGTLASKLDFLAEPFSSHVDARYWKKFDSKPFEAVYKKLSANYKDYMACKAHMKYSMILALGETVVEEYIKDAAQTRALPSILIPVLAERALSLEQGVCDALCRLGSRLSHFLMDEFQDTSVQQWAGMYSLVEEALSTNGSLTWVGDIKQSIFMWRDACPDLFDKIKCDENLTYMVGGKVEERNLPYNRRSTAEIVKFNNSLFNTLNTDAIGEILDAINSSIGKNEETISKIQLAFRGCVQDLPQDAKPGGLITVIKYEGNEGKDGKEFWENFNEYLLSYIQTRVKEKGEIALSDIMVLVRANKDATTLATALALEDVPVITENSLLLNGENLIRESVALLEFISNPSNDQALFEVLCGEAFLGHPELAGLTADNFHALAFAKGKKSLREQFLEIYPRIWEKLLEPFYKNSALLPPYDVVREWFRNMDLERRFPEKRIFLNAFLEYLHRSELAGFGSVQGFLEHWHDGGAESKAIMPDGVDAVQIKTIHKAKGLQAPVVFVPLRQSAMKTNHQQSSKRVQHAVGDDLNLNVHLLKTFDKEYENAMTREAQEILNLMYVAFTRAEKELHIFTSIKKNEEEDNRQNTQKGKKSKKKDEPVKSLLERMMDCAKIEISGSLGSPWVNEKWQNRAEATEKEIPAPDSPGPEGDDLSFPWISKLRVARNTLFTARDSAQRRGTFIHFCLENLHLTGNPEQDAQKAYNFELSHSGLQLTEDELKGIKEGLLWFASQKEAADWLGRGWPEHSMLDEAGNELRMDLVVPQDWGVLVIDYKSGHGTEENKEQMRAYLRCLQESGEFGGRLCGLLVYLDERCFLPLDLDGEGEAARVCPPLPFAF